MFLFHLVFAMSLCASVYICFVVPCWERADLLALVVVSNCEFVTFPICILGQVWYLIVSIPDLCTLTYVLLRCLSSAGPTVAQLEVFFSSDSIWVMGHLLCFIKVC